MQFLFILTVFVPFEMSFMNNLEFFESVESPAPPVRYPAKRGAPGCNSEFSSLKFQLAPVLRNELLYCTANSGCAQDLAR